MAKWQVGFVVDGARFEALMEMLQPMKIEGLEFKIVAGSAKRIRAGDKPAWEIVANMATDKPQQRGVFVEALRNAGFNNPSGVNQAIEKRAVRKVVVKGVAHLVKTKGGK
jgi:FtsP/CotA-like multicopper oxidase with cupredoxin domain